MKIKLVLSLIFLLSSAIMAADTGPNTNGTAEADVSQSHTTKRSRLIDRGGSGMYDGALEITNKLQLDRYLEMIGISTTTLTTPTTGHARVYLSSAAHEVLIKFDDGTITTVAGALGDITAVTAGLGLVGGGTSGAVTVAISTPIPSEHLVSTVAYRASTATWTAGQVYVGSTTFYGNVTGSSAVITNLTGTTLSANTAFIGLSTTNACGYLIGSTVQSLSFTSTTSSATTTTVFASTNDSGSITPKCASHKVLVTAVGELKSSNVALGNVYATLYRGTTNLGDANNGICAIIYSALTGTSETPCTMVYLDSPNTTSATTYKAQIRSSVGTITTTWGNSGSTQILVLQEIAY